MWINRYWVSGIAVTAALMASACQDPSTGGGMPGMTPGGGTLSVVSTSPASGATGVPTNTLVTATLSQNAGAVTPADFTLENAATHAAVSALVAVSGPSIILTPTAMLAPNTSYTATVRSTAEDLSGVKLGTDYSWSFKTGTTVMIQPPSVVSTLPADGTMGASIHGVITVTFNTAMDPASLSGAIGASTSAGAIAGAVSTAGNVATFTPSGDLPESATVQVTVSVAAKDMSGNALAAPYSFSFTTGARTVTTGTSVPTDSHTPTSPSVAMDALGNATVVFVQAPDGANQHVFSRSYNASAKTWSAVLPVDNLGSGLKMSDTSVGIDANGNLIALWLGKDSASNTTVWTSAYSKVAQAWGTPRSLSSTSASQPILKVSRSGAAVAIWLEASGASFNVKTSRYAPATGWSATALQLNQTLASNALALDVDAAGDATAAWVESGMVVFDSYFVSNKAWSAPQNYAPASTVGVAMGPSGNAMVVWSVMSGSTAQIFGARMEVNAAFGAAFPIVTNAGTQVARNLSVALDDADDTTLAWVSTQGTGTNEIYVINYGRSVAGGAFALSSLSGGILNLNLGDMPDFALSSDGHGGAGILFRQGGSHTKLSFVLPVALYATWPKGASDWTTPTSPEGNGATAGDPAISPACALNASGDFFMAYVIGLSQTVVELHAAMIE
jgi:hypothetical protein